MDVKAFGQKSQARTRATPMRREESSLRSVVRRRVGTHEGQNDTSRAEPALPQPETVGVFDGFRRGDGCTQRMRLSAEGARTTAHGGAPLPP